MAPAMQDLKLLDDQGDFILDLFNYTYLSI